MAEGWGVVYVNFKFSSSMAIGTTKVSVVRGGTTDMAFDRIIDRMLMDSISSNDLVVFYASYYDKDVLQKSLLRSMLRLRFRQSFKHSVVNFFPRTSSPVEDLAHFIYINSF